MYSRNFYNQTPFEKAMKFPIFSKLMKIYEKRFIRINFLNDIKGYDVDEDD